MRSQQSESTNNLVLIPVIQCLSSSTPLSPVPHLISPSRPHRRRCPLQVPQPRHRRPSPRLNIHMHTPEPLLIRTAQEVLRVRGARQLYDNTVTRSNKWLVVVGWLRVWLHGQRYRSLHVHHTNPQLYGFRSTVYYLSK